MDCYDDLTIRIGEIIGSIAEDQREKLVLYPFGKQGMLTKQILNWRYGIQEAFILDEGLASINKKIYSLDYLKDIDTSKYLFLITSNNLDCWDQIRKNLRKYVDQKNILELFGWKPFRYGDARRISLEMAAREIYEKNIPGAVAEAGVYRGDFARCINELFPDRSLYLFDSFEGFPERDLIVDKEKGYVYANGGFEDTSIEIVLQNMVNRNSVIIKKGYFPDSAVGLEEEFCFVSLDMDLYQPILAGLEYFYPRLCAGGYIFIHDCYIETATFYGGARQALLEFAHKEKIGYVMLPDGITAVITKPDFS